MSDIHTAPTRKIRELVRALQPTTLVVAGTRTQFDDWQREEFQARRHAVYVSEPVKLLGRGRDVVVVFLGTYYERRDLGEITEYVAIHPDWTTSFVREYSNAGGGLVAK